MTKTVPFDKIGTLTPGQRVTYKSPYGNFVGTVTCPIRGELLRIRGTNGREFTFGPEHFLEGEQIDVEEDQ